LEPTDTILDVKLRLAEQSPLSVSNQSLFLIDDCRSEVNEDEDLELRNHETLAQISQYMRWVTSGTGIVRGADEQANEGERFRNEEAPASILQSKLQFVVVSGLRDVADFVRALPASPKPVLTVGDGTPGTGDHQLHDPKGIATIPLHPHLLLAVSNGSNQLHLYQHGVLQRDDKDGDDNGGAGTGTGFGTGTGSGTGTRGVSVLAKVGKEDGTSGNGPGEFNEPWDVVCTSDCTQVL
jgi:hypothetical protein